MDNNGRVIRSDLFSVYLKDWIISAEDAVSGEKNVAVNAGNAVAGS